MQTFSAKVIHTMQVMYLHYLCRFHIQTSPWVSVYITFLEARDPWNLVLSDPVNLTFKHALQDFPTEVNAIVEKMVGALCPPGQVKSCNHILQLHKKR